MPTCIYSRPTVRFYPVTTMVAAARTLGFRRPVDSFPCPRTELTRFMRPPSTLKRLGAYTLSLNAPGGGGHVRQRLSLAGKVSTARSPATDCTLINAGDRTGAFVDVYTFNGFAGQQAAVAMVSTSFDTYLYLIPPDDSQVLENDDVSGRQYRFANILLPASSFCRPTASTPFSRLHLHPGDR